MLAPTIKDLGDRLVAVVAVPVQGAINMVEKLVAEVDTLGSPHVLIIGLLSHVSPNQSVGKYN
jgi:hypothetical protein